MLKFISTLFYIIFVSILVGVGGLLIGTMLPIPGNIEMKIVKSGSMEPAIPTGAVVVVKPSAAYAVGDVITFGADTRTEVPTTHRIVGVQGEGTAATYTTKGDANEEADPQTVARREVIGKVVFSLPYAGFVLDFARQPVGFVLLIAIPAGLVILEEILAIFREATKGRRRKDEDGDRGMSEGGGNASEEPFERNTLDLRGAPRIIYSQLRLMDEILVPTLEEVSESFQRRMQARYEPTPQPTLLAAWLRSDAYGTSTALTIGLVFVSTIFAGANGGTVAYFQDIESSVRNVFGAGERWAQEAQLALDAARLAETDLTSFAAFSDGAVLGESTEEPVAPPEEGTPPADDTPIEETAEEPTEPSTGPFGEPVEPVEPDEPESPQSPVNGAISEAPNEPQNETEEAVDEPVAPLTE